MKILLLGGTDLTLGILNTLSDAGYNIVGVVSLGKDFSISYNKNSVNSRYVPIGDVCREKNIKHLEYNKDNDALISFAEDVQADFCLVAGWYFLLPQRFIALFSKGCAGLHASLLPDLRGASPLNWALLLGRKSTGISMFQIDQKIDEGLLYGQKKITIDRRETITSLVKKTELAAIDLIQSCFSKLKAGKLILREQKGKPSYACPRVPEDSKIDWSQSAKDIDLLIRASTHPYAGAFCFIDGKKINIWEAEIYDRTDIYGRAGQISILPTETNPLVVCGAGVLKIVKATDESGEDQKPIIHKMNYRNFDRV